MLDTPIPTFTGSHIHLSKNPLQLPAFKPRYELEPLPAGTEEHVDSNRRRIGSTLIDILSDSERRSNLYFRVDEELTQANGFNYSRTFLCSLSELDNPSNMTDKFVVKLFDDRRGRVEELNEYSSQSTNAAIWSLNFMTAEELINNEINAYLTLKRVWGSTVPWFYGAFQVSYALTVSLTQVS